MVIGDWGGLPRWPFTSSAQIAVARALGEQAGRIGATFTLSLGDHFYYDGVDSVDDPRWIHTFEDVFTSEHLQSEKHFRVIAGNHDHEGNVSAQIAYSQKSPRWFFPNEYYDFVEEASGMSVHFVMIDTNILIRETSESRRQWAWLRNVLSKSSADFLVVAGHHPVWSSCAHGPTKRLALRLKPLLEEAKVSMYLSGHDHCAEHVADNDVQYHIIGAGSGFGSHGHNGRRSSIPAGLSKWHYEPRGSKEGAFAQVVVDPVHGLVLTHLDSNNEILYKTPAIPRRWAPVEAVEDNSCTSNASRMV